MRVRSLFLALALAACKKDPPPAASPAADAAANAAPAASSVAAPIASASPEPKAAAAPKGPPADLNVLLVSIDSLRADMPWAGYPRPIAPRLTELERKSVGYTHAYSISSYTSMSLGGLLAGKLPSELKRSGFFFGSYPEDNLFFPELLQKAGVRTLGAQAHGYFKDAGFQQGFDKWEIVPGIVFKNETDPNVTGPQHEAIAERLLSDPDLANKRFFAWFHFLDPHDQYVAHDQDGIPAFGKTLRDRYDAEVLFTDRQIGKLLDFVDKQPWGKRTAIIVTSDHGEAFGEHNQFAHGFELWENLVRIPMFFVVPGAEPRHVETPRSAIDLAPTICELLGVTPDAGFEGKSLVPELFGKAAEPRDVVLDLPMTSDNDKRRAIVRGDKKVIAFGKEEALRLFDLAADPAEKSPVSSGPELTELAAAYRQLAKGIKEVTPYACGAGCLNREYANKK